MSDSTLPLRRIVSTYSYLFVSRMVQASLTNVREKIAINNLRFVSVKKKMAEDELRYHLTQMERARARRYSDKGIFTRYEGTNGAYFIHQNKPWEIYPTNRRWTPNEHLEEH